jgi:hypothetical protein
LGGLDRFAIVLPLFATYSTAIVKFYLKHFAGDTRGRLRISISQATIFIAFPFALVMFLFGVASWKAFGTLTFQNFVNLLGVSETAFGVYVAMIVAEFFYSRKSKGQQLVSAGR